MHLIYSAVIHTAHTHTQDTADKSQGSQHFYQKVSAKKTYENTKWKQLNSIITVRQALERALQPSIEETLWK